MSTSLGFVRYSELSNWSVAHLLQSHFNYNKDYELAKIGSFLKRNKTQIIVDDNTTYKRVTIKLYNGGVFLRDTEIGKNIGTKKQFIIKEEQFLLSKIDARNGAFGVVNSEVDGAIITGNFWTFDVDHSQINPNFLSLITTTKQFMIFAQSASSGTTGRHYFQEDKFLDTKIPLPSLKVQQQIVEKISTSQNILDNLKLEYEQYMLNFNNTIFNRDVLSDNNLLEFLNYSKLNTWSVKNLLENHFNYNKDFEFVKIGSFLKRNKTQIIVDDNTTYKRVTIKLYNGGVFLRDIEIGRNIGTKKQFIIKEGQFLLSKIDARNGAFGVVNNEVDGAIITGNFWTFDVDYTKINPNFLSLMTTTKQFMNFAQSASSGTTGRHYFQEDKFLDMQIPFTSIQEQNDLVRPLLDNLKAQENESKKLTQALEEFEKEVFSEA